MSSSRLFFDNRKAIICLVRADSGFYLGFISKYFFATSSFLQHEEKNARTKEVAYLFLLRIFSERIQYEKI